jgi:hypothetical protein
MSSYLTVYVKLKNVEKPAPIISWSRNNDVYQAMYRNVAYIGNGDEWQFSDLTEDLINNAIEEINSNNKKSKAYLEEYEKHAGENEGYIQCIIEFKEELKYAEKAIQELEFLKSLVQEASYGSYDDEDPIINVEKYLVNVD